jgi:hypothetical protein
VRDDWGRGQVIHGDAEKAVYLGRMQVHGEDAIGPSRVEQIGHEPSGDGDARGVLFVGARIGIVGDDGSDAPR